MKHLLFLGAAFLATPAMASGAFTYADFEASVNHVNIEECPEVVAEGDVFCRVAMHNDALHVFVFESEGEQLFVSVHSFYEDEIELEFGDD